MTEDTSPENLRKFLESDDTALDNVELETKIEYLFLVPEMRKEMINHLSDYEDERIVEAFNSLIKPFGDEWWNYTSEGNSTNAIGEYKINQHKVLIEELIKNYEPIYSYSYSENYLNNLQDIIEYYEKNGNHKILPILEEIIQNLDNYKDTYFVYNELEEAMWITNQYMEDKVAYDLYDGIYIYFDDHHQPSKTKKIHDILDRAEQICKKLGSKVKRQKGCSQIGLVINRIHQGLETLTYCWKCDKDTGKKKYMKVKVLENLPGFTGSNGKTYALNKLDQKIIPIDNAKMLESAEKVEIIESKEYNLYNRGRINRHNPEIHSSKIIWKCAECGEELDPPSITDEEVYKCRRKLEFLEEYRIK